MRPKDSDRLANLEEAVNTYFNECDSINGEDAKKIKKPYTFSGLLCRMGITRKEFERLSKRNSFAPLFSSALAKIEAFTEEHALTGELSAAAAANSLKYNFGWGEHKPSADEDTAKSIRIILDGDLVKLGE